MSKIKVENIVKTFNRHSRNANKVLKGVSFELPEKGLTCIFGKSGSGKTTLLNIIGGLEKADSGKVYIDGECTSGKTDKIRNAKIGFIFQNYYLEKGYTIAEILRNQMIIAGFKDEKEIARRTEEALKLVDMERFKNKLGDALSGGQQQRVAIARAIVKGSDVILADEPTGNLDAENTMKVMDILKEISKTQLVVIVTHEVSLIKKYADSHIKIVDGELVEDGEIEETDLAPATYDNIKEGNETHSVLTTFTKSTAKRNGRLFTLKTIFKRNNAGGEKAYSVGNVFKQIFILALAVVMTFFSFSAFEALSAVTENKTLGKNTVYTNLNSYSVLRKTDESHYKSIDFFDTEMRTGSFSYGGLEEIKTRAFENAGCVVNGETITVNENIKKNGIKFVLPLAKMKNIEPYAFKTKGIFVFTATESEGNEDNPRKLTAAAKAGEYFFVESMSGDYYGIMQYVKNTDTKTMKDNVGNDDLITIYDVRYVATAGGFNDASGHMGIGYSLRGKAYEWGAWSEDFAAKQHYVYRYEVMEGSVYYLGNAFNYISFGIFSKIHKNAFTDMEETHYAIYNNCAFDIWMDADKVKNQDSSLFEEGWFNGRANSENTFMSTLEDHEDFYL